MPESSLERRRTRRKFTAGTLVEISEPLSDLNYREQSMRYFADGVVALCIRTQQGENSVLDQWYGLILFVTELDDERLMRLRLERLICWRESPERWSSYQHMLPTLILARSQRQRDHWQHAVEATALKLRLEPLGGALASLPPLVSSHVNPWLLNWRVLSTEVSYHLQDLLRRSRKPRRAAAASRSPLSPLRNSNSTT